MSRTGRLFAVVAVIEAFTWAGLLAGMFLKYVTETTEAGVWLFGRLHGAAFLAYVVVALVAAVRLRWGAFRTLVTLAAGVPPLTTLLVERWLRRTGHLADPAARDVVGDRGRGSDELVDAS
jgi:integral membrane protein